MMKKNILIISIIAFITNACISSDFCENNGFFSNKIEGNGNIITEQREIQNFSKIKASRGLNVIIKKGLTDSLSVVADENLHKHIMTKVEGDKLKIWADVNISSSSTKTVFVTYRSIDEIDASSASSIVSKSTINCNHLKIEVSSAATLSTEIETKETKIDISSAATCNITGKSAFLTIDASSAATLNADDVNCGQIDANSSSAASINLFGESGILKSESSSGSSINAFGMKVDEAFLEVSSGASIKTNVNSYLRAEASSGGSIKYKGSPKTIDKNQNSGGSINGD